MVTDKSASKPLLGIFGGTFDPIHRGHLQAIADLQQDLEFDVIHWVLSARPPHKNRVSASIDHRFAMLSRALSPYHNYVADDCEIKRLEKSWTLHTVQEFIQRFPEHRPVLIIGGDSLSKLPSWYRYPELINTVSFVVMARPGYAFDVPAEMQDQVITSATEFVQAETPCLWVFEHSDYAISSTEIRAQLSRYGSRDSGFSDSLSDYLTDDVIDYIQQHHCYSMQADQIKDLVVNTLEDIKGHDIRVLDIEQISDFADYMIVVSGTSDTHVKALARAASDRLRQQGVKPLNEDGQELGEWVLVDFGDVVLHVMRPEVRDYYELEKLWDQDVREMVKQHREQQEG